MNNQISGMEQSFSVSIYSLTSISMIVLNKSFVRIFEARLNFSILFIQAVLGLVLVIYAKKMDYITYPNFNQKVFLMWIPLACLNVGMIATSMLAFQYISIPLFTVFKNTTTIWVALGEWYFLGKDISNISYVAFCVILSGNIVSLWDVATFYSSSGLLWTFANILFTAVYLLYMKYALSRSGTNLGNFGPLFYNNLISTPILLVFALFLGEINSLDPRGFGVFVLLILDGAMIGFTSFWCIRSTSATTFSVIGSLNKIPLSVIGEILFREPTTYWGRIGVILVVLGGLIYGFVSVPVARDKKSSATV